MTTTITSANASVHDFFGAGPVDLPGLSEYFDGLPDEARVSTMRSMRGGELARLFEAAKGFRRVTLEDFVPRGVGPLQEVIHHGRNSLPLFTTFQKRFCRPSSQRAAGGDRLWGYNEQAMKWATGPGYFVAKPSGSDEVVIDYFEIPPEKPAEWPPIAPNSARLGRFVYDRTRDYMRGVSTHVSIGRAMRDDKPMDAWFVLVR